MIIQLITNLGGFIVEAEPSSTLRHLKDLIIQKLNLFVENPQDSNACPLAADVNWTTILQPDSSTLTELGLYLNCSLFLVGTYDQISVQTPFVNQNGEIFGPGVFLVRTDSMVLDQSYTSNNSNQQSNSIPSNFLGSMQQYDVAFPAGSFFILISTTKNCTI
jgi:hypothetical protein